MFGSKYLRAHAAQLIAIGHTVADAVSKAALIEMADDLNRWADELDGIDPPKSNGGGC
ncbi:MAG TPA: hypothetical protein VG328_03195 [Stellaceae bacterium]|jgi:hypothetical protein|nr:hypothetical protein [Stellaceae bacterium]